MGKVNYKSIIVPREGYHICNVDLVSAEMLTLALLAECPSMLEMLEKGEDLHKKVACVAFGVTPDQVTHEQRQLSKIINYLTNYGGNSWVLKNSIVKSLGIDIAEEECQRIMDARFKIWPEIPLWWDKVFNELENNMFLVNLLGRRKPFFALRHIEKNGSYQRNDKLEKNARAWLNQSTVADITKLAMIRLWNKQKETGGELFKFLLEVHDSLSVEYKIGHEAEIYKTFQDCFNIELDAGWTKYVVPISLEVGPDYGRVKELKL